MSDPNGVTHVAWWLRLVPEVEDGQVGVELWPTTGAPRLRLTQAGNEISVDLVHVKALIAALTEAAADLAGAVASGQIPPDVTPAAAPTDAGDVDQVPELSKAEALALALSLNKPAALAAYAEAELRRHYDQPATCWQCGAAVDERDEVCPACNVELVPF